jgi:hypothetical protein
MVLFCSLILSAACSLSWNKALREIGGNGGNGNGGNLVGCTDFVTARKRLLENAPRLLVTNLQLHAHNGLHLVYLAVSLSLPTRCIVYADREDAGLMREARPAGAV